MGVRINESRWQPGRRAGWIAALAALVLGLGVWLWPSSDRPTAGQGGETFLGNDSRLKASPTGAGPASAAGRELVEVDMLGTRLDVSRLFQLGFGGGLQMDGETRATLDTLLLQMSDPPTPQETEKLEYTLRQGLPKEEAEKAWKLFQSYRSYQTDLRGEGPQLGIPETAKSVDEYFAEVARIQRRHFDDATATALFGADLRNARAVMMASVIDQNPNLSQGQKKEQIDALRAELPPDQRGVIPEPSGGAASEAK